MACCGNFKALIPLIEHFSATTDREEAARQFLIHHGVLPRRGKCGKPDCQRELTYRPDKRQYVCNATWRENGVRQRCGYRQSERANTFCAKARITYYQIIIFGFHYLEKGFAVNWISRNLDIHETTAVQWALWFGETLKEFRDRHPPMIGGPGLVVELDETHIHTVNCERGRRGLETWIFGGIERYSRKTFLVNLDYTDHTPEKRKLEILRHIRPGSIIYTDSFRSSNDLEAMGFTHHIVNHSVEVVGIHTQTIERLWVEMNEWVIKRGRKPQHWKYYLARYEFVRNYETDAERFHNMWLLCARVYQHKLPQ